MCCLDGLVESSEGKEGLWDQAALMLSNEGFSCGNMALNRPGTQRMNRPWEGEQELALSWGLLLLNTSIVGRLRNRL